MITRIEAKALADSSISDQRKGEIEELFHQRITEEASRAKYSTQVNDITMEMLATQQERDYAQELLRSAPNLYTTTDFIEGNGIHEVIWS